MSDSSEDTLANHYVENSAINLYCLRDFLGFCGCPKCCAADGLTALYCVDDFVPGVHPCGWWPKVVCTEKLAMLVKERIVPGWPGAQEDEVGTPTRQP